MGAASNPLRVAYILPYLVAGGTEGHVLSLVRGIDRGRYSPVVVALAGGGELEPAFRGEGIPVHVLGYGNLSRGKGPAAGTVPDIIRCLRAGATLLRKEGIRIAHCYLPAANTLGPVAARLGGIRRTIVSKRSLSNYKERSRLAASAESLGNRLADVVMVNSDAVRRDVEQTETCWQGKFRKIYNGVAPIPGWGPEERAAFRRSEGIPVDARVVLCVSNFYPYKGHADLVDAIARIAPGFPGAVFLLVGRDSGTLERTRSLARERGIGETVRFPGGRTDVPDLLRASDLFVHPSHEEGFSNAILEAMAAGLPVVATDVGGNPEAVVDGETGRLVPVRDPEAIAAALGELLADERLRRAMGESGRKRAMERFSLGRMVAEIESLYESCASGDVGRCAE